MESVAKLTDFESRLGYEFVDRALLETARTHRSAAHELALGRHYERMEFLGDSVLGLVVSEWLYRELAESREGDLALRKSQLVSADSLAAYAEKLDLGSLLLLSQGEDRSGGRSKSSLLADSMEAVLGAVYLDGGLAAARGVIESFVDFAYNRADPGRSDAKSSLQEELQGMGLETPIYRVLAEEGPDHRKIFTVEVLVDGVPAGEGSGSSKKIAEQSAAQEALAARPWSVQD